MLRGYPIFLRQSQGCCEARDGDGKIQRWAVRPEPGGRHKNVIDGPRAKTTAAGEYSEWVEGHADICGHHMTSLLMQELVFGVKEHLVCHFRNKKQVPVQKHSIHCKEN